MKRKILGLALLLFMAVSPQAATSQASPSLTAFAPRDSAAFFVPAKWSVEVRAEIPIEWSLDGVGEVSVVINDLINRLQVLGLRLPDTPSGRRKIVITLPVGDYEWGIGVRPPNAPDSTFRGPRMRTFSVRPARFTLGFVTATQESARFRLNPQPMSADSLRFVVREVEPHSNFVSAMMAGISMVTLPLARGAEKTFLLLVYQRGKVVQESEVDVKNPLLTTVGFDIPAADNFALEQNYPNPFNPTTTIAFTLPFTRHVKLAIYNQLGQLVAVLVKGTMSAGDHAVPWSPAANFPSGLYFARLESGEIRLTKRMLLVR